MSGAAARGLGWVLATSVLVSAQAHPNPPLFRSDAAELVVVPVTVTDPSGSFVETLTAADFRVFDNGRPQPVALFTGANTPVSVALVVDASGSMHERMNELVAAGSAFARASHPDDELFLVAFNDTAEDPLGGGSMRAADESALIAALRSLRARGRTALYDGLLRGLERLAAARHPRRVLVLVSDGGDNASGADREQVMDRARRSNVTIYTIGVFERGARDANPGVLRDLARTTGGERFLPSSPGALLQACLRIAREVRSGYLIAYEPPERDGLFHRIEVRAVNPQARRAEIRTRPGYYAPPPGR